MRRRKEEGGEQTCREGAGRALAFLFGAQAQRGKRAGGGVSLGCQFFFYFWIRNSYICTQADFNLNK